MACSVYCLTPSAEEVDPLVRRLREAGVAEEDITVVVREPGGLEVRRPATRSAQWWSVPLVPATMWWAAALYVWPVAVRIGFTSSRETPAVIPLARFRAGR